MAARARVTCEEMVRELPDFLDRELPAIRQAELQRHLDECARCFRKYRLERSLVDRIHERLSSLTLPPGLAARVLASIGHRNVRAP